MIAGAPSPPAPTTRTDALRILSWPVVDGMSLICFDFLGRGRWVFNLTCDADVWHEELSAEAGDLWVG